MVTPLKLLNANPSRLIIRCAKVRHFVIWTTLVNQTWHQEHVHTCLNIALIKRLLANANRHHLLNVTLWNVCWTLLKSRVKYQVPAHIKVNGKETENSSQYANHLTSIHAWITDFVFSTLDKNQVQFQVHVPTLKAIEEMNKLSTRVDLYTNQTVQIRQDAFWTLKHQCQQLLGNAHICMITVVTRTKYQSVQLWQR